ncbi:MAG: phosphotransferase [Solirubrobacteraceae bacterium]|nr:phosphotransferase [Solirubrobacteraceae bacterium]
MTVRLSVEDAIAAAALPRYDLSPQATATLIDVSENATYRVDDPETGRRAALRVHRPGYRDAPEIESELRWMDALRAAGVVDAPAAIPGRHGARVLSVAAEGECRDVVLFAWLDGTAPSPEDDLTDGFRMLGAISAALHEHARRWPPPPGFRRPRWEHATMLGADAAWGRWQDGLGVGREELALLSRLDAVLERRLAAFGTGPDRFGLVHADLRLANLLVDDGAVRVIDFDDCGWSWWLYDFATAVSFFEDDPAVPALAAAWADGYRTVAPLSAADEAELETFVLLRRLLLVAWVGSHQHAPEAQELGAAFTAGTCALAESYLSRFT